MRALIQRVTEASVVVDGNTVGAINGGLLILLGVGKSDTQREADFLVKKIAELRLFNDENGKMNLSLLDTGGGALVISQFTLYGDTKKGRRPSFTNSAPPELANELYEYFVTQLNTKVEHVATGIFAADMKVSLLNDGPVTFMLESEATS